MLWRHPCNRVLMTYWLITRCGGIRVTEFGRHSYMRKMLCRLMLQATVRMIRRLGILFVTQVEWYHAVVNLSSFNRNTCYGVWQHRCNNITLTFCTCYIMWQHPCNNITLTYCTCYKMWRHPCNSIQVTFYSTCYTMWRHPCNTIPVTLYLLQKEAASV